MSSAAALRKPGFFSGFSRSETKTLGTPQWRMSISYKVRNSICRLSHVGAGSPALGELAHRFCLSELFPLLEQRILLSGQQFVECRLEPLQQGLVGVQVLHPLCSYSFFGVQPGTWGNSWRISAGEIMKYQGDGAGIMNLLSQDDVMSLASYEGFSVLCHASENE